MLSPAWLATVVQVPAETYVMTKPETVQMLGVELVSVTGRVELAVGATVRLPSLRFAFDGCV